MRTINRFYFTLEESNINLNELVNADDISNKLVNLIKLKYGDCWAVYNDVAVNPWDFSNDVDLLSPSESSVNKWKNKFKYIYAVTFDKYNKLIELYTANENKLMDSIKTEVTTNGNDLGKHSSKNTGSDSVLHTGNNIDNSNLKTTEGGTDTVTLAKSGNDTETDTRAVTNSGTDVTTNADTTSDTLSGTDTVSVKNRKMINDTPQNIYNNLDSAEYASMIDQNEGSTSTSYGKKDTHNGLVTSTLENGLKQTHSGNLKRDYNTTDTTTTDYGHNNTSSGLQNHEFNEQNQTNYGHIISNEDSRITNGSTITMDDRESIIDRLHNIHKHYDQLYKEWVNEFKPLFGELI